MLHVAQRATADAQNDLAEQVAAQHGGEDDCDADADALAADAARALDEVRREAASDSVQRQYIDSEFRWRL